MDTINFKTKQLLKERFFNEEAWDRWAELSFGLLNNQSVVPMWADKNFRWGYQLVLNVKDALNDWDAERQVHRSLNKEDVIEKIIDMFEEEDGLDCCIALLKGVEILEKDEDEPKMAQPMYPEVRQDLLLLCKIAEKAKKCQELSDELSEELERQMKVCA